MPYCGECGKQYKDSLKFCPYCGTPNPLYQEAKIDKPDAPTDQNINKTVKRGENFYGRLNLEDLPQDYIIDDRYEVKEKLGQGGFGAVYQVYDRELETDKALKVIPEAIVNDKEAMFDLRKEAKTMISLNHPNIVRVYDFHRRGKIKYIDMEYIDGKTLTDIKLEYSNKQIPEKEVKEYAIKIAKGLLYAHSKNVIHKDIKPQNVMITKDNEVKLMDFGIAETVRTSMSRIQNTSSSGTLVYMSPEQLKGRDVGKESDIYSFGAMLYELLSGHPPFYKGAIEHQVLNKKPKPLDFISDNLNKLIMRCLEKDYKDRFRDFAEVEEFLQKEGGTEDGERKSDENGKKKEETEENKHKIDDNQEDEDRKKIENEEEPEEPKKPKKKSGVSKIIWILLVIGVLLVSLLIKNYLHYYRIEQQVASENDLVFVEGGTFRMGSNKGGSNEKPVHSVTVDDFYISKYEVTQAEWEEVMGDNPSNFKGDNRPVENVSWYDAVEFCNKKSEMEGLEKCYNGKGKNIKCDFSANGYRLPTEAEWEYAARGGNKSRGYKYSGSNDIDRVGWYDDNSGSKTHPVGQKKSNELGIYDMSGNVWEWCSDSYDSDYYKNSPSNNPTGPSSGSQRVLRGGGWDGLSYFCRGAGRARYDPGTSVLGGGFRFVKSVE